MTVVFSRSSDTRITRGSRGAYLTSFLAPGVPVVNIGVRTKSSYSDTSFRLHRSST